MQTVRDSTAGQLVRLVAPTLLPYEEERKGWKCPSHYSCEERTLVASRRDSKVSTPNNDKSLTPSATMEKPPSTPTVIPRTPSLLEAAREREQSQQESINKADLVDWYDDDDQENPKSWSFNKKVFVSALICLLTFSVYIGSSIYTPSTEGVMEHFNVSRTYATMGLSLYVLAYGLGPMVLSPLSEIPRIGRNPVYIVTLTIFVALQFPTIWAPNKETLMAMRFFAGFVGSPALATGGASLGDIWEMHLMPYAIIAWSCSAVAGPVLGPIIGGFAAQLSSWRWPLLELLFISGFTLIVLVFALPETYAPTILLRRAQRLRKATGNQSLRSQSELDQSELSAGDILLEALWRPISLMRDPAVTYSNVYIGLVYSVFYTFFESLPLVYEGIYGFSLGLTGLVFLSFLVGNFFAALGYFLYLKYYDVPRMQRQYIPEDRLVPALVASLCIPVSLFWFGWTSRESIHWIVPTISLAFYLPGIWLLFQGMMAYLPSSYPNHAASVLAGNDLVRSSMASAFPIFAHALFTNLGIGGGCSLLGGLSILFIPPLYLLWKYGAKLRSMSKFAAQ